MELPPHVTAALRNLVAAIAEVDASRVSLSTSPSMSDATGTVGISLHVLVDGKPLDPEIETKIQEMVSQAVRTGQSVSQAHRETFGEVCRGVLRIGAEYDTPCSIVEVTEEKARLMVVASAVPEPIARAHTVEMRVALDFTLNSKNYRMLGTLGDLCEQTHPGLPKMIQMTLRAKR